MTCSSLTSRPILRLKITSAAAERSPLRPLEASRISSSPARSRLDRIACKSNPSKRACTGLGTKLCLSQGNPYSALLFNLGSEYAQGFVEGRCITARSGRSVVHRCSFGEEIADGCDDLVHDRE
uniref:Uncharacterized protein n=1 Tax=Fusarium oxysporum (strain Fo5176) TaxID=660025 RepID=A0A0C4BKZ3_FUSOF